jgi:hypothetical protein
MSQTCLISYRKNVSAEDQFYDCIYDENGSLETLIGDWLCLDEDGWFLCPWKLNIRDKELFQKFLGDFVRIKDFCPQFTSLLDCWAVYIDGVTVYYNCPAWLDNAIQQAADREKSK